MCPTVRHMSRDVTYIGLRKDRGRNWQPGQLEIGVARSSCTPEQMRAAAFIIPRDQWFVV